MKFRLFNTDHSDTWRPWFAWYPVFTDNGSFVWLSYVEWMRIGGFGPYSGVYYRIAKVQS